MAFATEASRFYDPATREAVAEVMGKNGKARKPNVRDARERGLKMSVTSYIRKLAAPGLEIWKQRNVLMSALTATRREGESDDAFIDRIITDSQQEGRDAANEGTDCHKAVESFVAHKPFDAKWDNHIAALRTACAEHGIDLTKGIPERAYVTDQYGCRIDWHDQTTCIDFKTKDTVDASVKAYFEQAMQLAANAQAAGIKNPRLINAYIGRSDGAVKLHIWQQEDVERALLAFNSLVQTVNYIESLA